MIENTLTLPVLIYRENGQYWAQSMQFDDCRTSGPSASSATEGMRMALFERLIDVVSIEDGLIDAGPDLISKMPDGALWHRFAAAQVNFFETFLTEGRT